MLSEVGVGVGEKCVWTVEEIAVNVVVVVVASKDDLLRILEK